MSALTKAQMETMVSLTIRSKTCMAVAIEKLQPDHFFEPGEEPLKLVWLLAQEYYVLHSKLIPKRILQDKADERLQIDGSLEMYRDDVFSLIDLAYSIDEQDVHEDAVINIYLAPFLNERIFKEVYRSIDVDNTSVDSLLLKLETAKNAAAVTVVEKESIFDFENDSEDDLRPPTPTGCTLFDALVGGTRPSHLVGVLAPFGGGKTLLCTDLCIKTAANKDHAFLFHYEQPVRSNIRPRIMANLTGKPTSYFESNNYAAYDDDTKNKIEDSKYIENYLHVYDMQKDGRGDGGVAEIEAIIRKTKVVPSLIAIDWLGLLVDNYINMHLKTTPENKTGIYSSMMAGIRKLANKYNCEVVIAHQLNADAGKKSVTDRPSMYDAADYRKFAATVDTCMIICGADPNNITRIFNAKNRGAIEDVWIRLRPETASADLLQGQQFVTIKGPDGRMYHRSRDASIGID